MPLPGRRFVLGEPGPAHPPPRQLQALDAWGNRWEGHLNRSPGPTVFFSSGNEFFLALSLVLVVTIAVVRRKSSTWPPRGRWPLALLGVAIGCYAVSMGTHFLSRGQRVAAEGVSVVAWEVSLVLLACVGLWLPVLPRLGGRSRDLLAILGLALLPRMAWLTRPAPPFNFEEMLVGLWTRYARDGRLPEIWGPGFYDIPMLVFNVKALFMEPFSDHLFGLRFSSVLCGMGVVVVTYLFAAEVMPGRAPAALAGIFAAFHHVLLYYSRDGMYFIDPALAVVGTAYFLLRASRGGVEGWRAAVAGGLFSGLLVQDYASCRATPVVAVLFLLTRFFAKGGRKDAARHLGAYLLAFFMALGPFLLAYAESRGSISTREAEVMAFGPRDLLTFSPVAWAKLRDNIAMTIWKTSFGVYDDHHYRVDASFLNPLLLPGVLLGIFVCLRSLHRPSHRLVLLCLAVPLGLGAIPTREIIMRRNLAVIPAMALLFALGASWAVARLPRPALALTFLLLAITSALQVDLVLRRDPRARPPDLASATATYLARHPGQEVSLLTLPDLTTRSRWVQFLAPGASVRYAASASEVTDGIVLVSARNAPALRELLALPGATLEKPWELPEAWTRWESGESKPNVIEVEQCAPVLVRLPALPSAERRIVPSLGRVAASRRSPSGAM